ncbi:hypothetical protein OROHE_005793 [Orobanche hederae]
MAAAHFAPYNNSSCCLLLQIIIAILFLLTPSSRGTDQGLVNQICGQFGKSPPDKVFCLAFYKQNPTSGGIKGLTKTTVMKTLVHASDTGNYILRKIRSSGNGTELQNLYKDCKTTYNSLVGQFTNAQLAIMKNDYASMKSDIRDCERSVTGCQTAMGSTDSNLATQNKQNLALVKMSIKSGSLI